VVSPVRRYRIDVPDGTWTTVRNGVGAYFIGSAADNWTYDVSYQNDSGTWKLGLAYGNYEGCGWILAANVTYSGQTGSNQCQNWGQPSIYTFSNGVINCAPGTCNGPKKVYTTGYADMCLNVKPWYSYPIPTNCIRTLPPNTCVEWRYESKTSEWVAIKLRSVADPDGSWGFIPRFALPSVMPTGQESCP